MVLICLCNITVITYVVNDVWDSILATEEYTEKELLDMPAGEYEKIARETICTDIADILYNWLE